MTLLSSLVLTNTWRLVLLAILAIALYSNAWHLWEGVYRFIEPFQSLFSWPVLPAIAGFKLATTRDYSSGGICILLAQAALTVLLLSIALSSFHRRDVILKSEATPSLPSCARRRCRLPAAPTTRDTRAPSPGVPVW